MLHENILDKLKYKKSAVHIIKSSQYNAPTNTLFKSLQDLKLTDIYIQKLSTYMQRIHYETIPSDICCLFQINANEARTQYKTQINHTNSPIPLCRKSQQTISFVYTGPELWSTLSTTTKTSITISS